jgi:hypothetical protein
VSPDQHLRRVGSLPLPDDEDIDVCTVQTPGEPRARRLSFDIRTDDGCAQATVDAVGGAWLQDLVGAGIRQLAALEPPRVASTEA